jgi:hypothetical protein
VNNKDINMEESKAISPEVKGLFDTIKSQAKEYEKAYKYLEIEKLKLEQQRKDLDRLMDDLRNEVSYTTLKLNQKVQDTLTFIETRTEKTIKIYDNLENIVDLRDSLSQLHGLVKKQVSEVENFLKVEIPKTLKEFDNLLKNVKSKSESEMENILGNFRHKMEKYFESETQKLDQKNALKFKQQEARILNLEQKLTNLNDSLSDDIKNTLMEFTELRNKVSNSSYQNADSYTNMQSRIYSQIDSFSKKFENFNKVISDVESWKKSSLMQMNSNKTAMESLDFTVSRLLAKVAGYEDIFAKNEKKYRYAIIISFISLMGILGMLLKELGLY